ncbi:hypothetical protein GUJ93_ZPchr0008g13913 [Zizania palustris]|uniref:Uncharacterized protein n=1 Tax=Zizania palustris TaxID=103762 RepID=A0A8J5QX32_ZIZPA|nr:hypothetical protein GUJ93_ZPchr0008g13913 [Zizania palustris]
MQSHADAGCPAPTAPYSPTRSLCPGDDDGGHYFFSAPASPVHYILRSPPSSTAAGLTATQYAPAADGEYSSGAGDFEFAARQHGDGDGATAMSCAEELFVAGRIRVGCLSPIRQEIGFGEQEDGEDGVDGQRPRPRRARSASPPRSPRLAKTPEPSDSFASASSSSSSTSTSAKNTRRRNRISLRDLLLGGAGAANNPADEAAATGAESERSSGFWLPSIWPPSRPKKTTPPCPAPMQPGRRPTSSDRSAPGKRAAREDAPRRRTTSLPYRQGLVLGCLGFGARSYGLAKSMHPLSSR